MVMEFDAAAISPLPRRRSPTLSTPLSGHVSQPHINLTLTVHTITTIEAVLPAGTTTHTTAHVYLTHPTIPLNLGHLQRLHTYLNPSNTQTISHSIIYHHLLISAKLTLVPKDRPPIPDHQ